MNKKWYLFEQQAEGNAYFVVEMSDEEFEVMRTVFGKMEQFYHESYSGKFGQMRYGPFDSKDEAIMTVLKNECVYAKALKKDYLEMYEQAEKELENESL